MTATSTAAYCGQKLIGDSIATAAMQIIIVGARFYTRYIQRTSKWNRWLSNDPSVGMNNHLRSKVMDLHRA